LALLKEYKIMSEKIGEFFAARHTIKPKGEDRESMEYKGASEKGVELAKERAHDVLNLLENAKDGTVMFIGGASEVIRTKSLDHILGDEIKRIVQEKQRDDVMVMTQKDIAPQEYKDSKGYTDIIRETTEKIEANSNKKIIVEFPLFLKQFAMGRERWIDKNGDFTAYTKALLEKHNNNVTECLKDWIANEGQIGELEGPNPTKVAEEHLEGIKRLQEFAQKHIPDRPLIIGAAGHSLNLDALAIYLANNGKVDAEGFEKVGEEMIKETELARVEIENGKSKLVYKEQEFPIEESAN